MTCYLKVIYCIDDVPAVKSYLFGDNAEEEDLPTDEEVNAWNEDSWAEDWDESNAKSTEVKTKEKEDNWLQKCHVALSPALDLLAIAFDRKVALLSATSTSSSNLTSDGPSRYKIVNQVELGDEPGEHITSLLCIPLVSLKKTSHGSVDWSCAVVGFSSGFVRIYTENGNQLISQLLHESAVIEIKCRTKDTGVRSNMAESQSDEVTILYDDAIILLEGFSLFQTLRACRSQVALAAASGGISIDPPPLSYKKWRLVGNQSAISSHISPGVIAPNPFDHLRTASILGGYQVEVRGYGPAMTCFVAAGSAPYTGFYYAIQGSAPLHLSHVALAVANKLKSALYNSASRWLSWGTGSAQETEQTPKPKVEVGSPLDIRCGMPDALRHANNIILAPGAHLTTLSLAATTDSLGRVILIDVTRAIALRMWKGYRDAQVGFVRVFDNAHRRRRSDEIPKSKRHVLFMLIYAPRRGLLEVWACVNGPRVGAFNVGKNGRLLCNGFGMLGVNTDTMSETTQYPFQCCLIDANGMAKEVVIPFHMALSDANCKKARDFHLLKQLSLLLHSKKRTGDEAVKLLLEIRITVMIRRGLDKLVRTKLIGADALRNCLTSLQSRVNEGGATRKPEKDLSKFCQIHLRLITLYESLQKMNNNCVRHSSINLNDVGNIDIMCDLLHMTRAEAEEGLSTVSLFLSSRQATKVSFVEDDKPCLDIAEFLGAFSIVESSENDTDKDWHASLKPYDENKFYKFGAFIFYSSLFGSSSVEDVLFTIADCLDVKPRAVLELIFGYWLSQTDLISNNLGNCIGKLYNYIDTCCKKNISSDNDDEMTLWQWMRDEVCVSSDNCFATYILALVARGVAITHNTRDDKNDDEGNSDMEDWEKMQKEDVDEYEPSTYKESIEESEMQSGEWETLWMDVEKWNLFVSQIQDCIYINTAILLGRAKMPRSSSSSKHDDLQNENALSSLDEQNKAAVSVKDLLSNGPGYMAEIVAHSICQLNIPPACIEKRETDDDSDLYSKLDESQKEFLTLLHSSLYTKFPYSLAPDCLYSHCFWELMMQWNKDPMMVDCLTLSLEHLKLVTGDEQARHGITLMCWKTAIARRYIALLKLIEKVGKAPKDRLCRKEVGISDTLMPKFCGACTDILQIMADSAEAPRETTASKHYLPMAAEDSWLNVEGKRSIMDIGRGHARAHLGLLQEIMYAVFIVRATTEFSLRGVKPMTGLFDLRGKACLTLDLTTKHPALPDGNMMPLETLKARSQFLRKIVTATVHRLADTLDNDEISRSEKIEVKEDLQCWIETATNMAYEFHVSYDKIKLHVVEELFRNGLDEKGMEASRMIPDKEALSSSLLLIAGQRLSYILSHASTQARYRMLASMTPSMSNWIKSKDPSILRRPDATTLKDTAKLATHAYTMMSDEHSSNCMAQSLAKLSSELARAKR